jgi:pyruvate dehydrogenase E2 component (dihydrolipoyllysine-residue acetyltransferase)
MAIGVMPALEMAQESDKVISWLKQEGEIVAKGEPLLEVEADIRIFRKASSHGRAAEFLRDVAEAIANPLPYFDCAAWVV